MSEPMSDDDMLRLEEELRRAARLLDPVPERLVRQARYAYAFHTVDAELAELTFDSLAPEHAGAVRGPAGPRLLTFEAATLTVEIEIDEDGDGLRLTGRISPPRAADVDVGGGGGGGGGRGRRRAAGGGPGRRARQVRLRRAGGGAVRGAVPYRGGDGRHRLGGHLGPAGACRGACRRSGQPGTGLKLGTAAWPGEHAGSVPSQVSRNSVLYGGMG
jgi:hypothetical protein